MNSDKLSEIKVTKNNTIDLHLVDAPIKNVLIVGNTINLFGMFDDDADPIISNMYEYDWPRLQWIRTRALEGTKFTVIGEQEEKEYYELLFNKHIKNSFNISVDWKFMQTKEPTDYIKKLEYIQKKNMKFDYVIANPPYNKTLHLDVFKKCIDTLNGNGELVIIEPATWLIDLKDKSTRSNAYKLYAPFKKELEGHIKSIEIENRNDDFSTSMIVPFSIVHYIKSSSKLKQIEFTCFGNKTYIDSIFDANFIGKKDVIDSILNKIKLHDCVNNHILNSRNKNKENISYIRYRDIIGRHSYPSNADKIKINDGREFYSTYILPLIHHKDQEIYFTQPKNAKGKPFECVVGTYQELINYKHYVLSNNLPLFINICMAIDQNNNSLKYVPWLVDKQYTDNEIYKMFNFTQQEINLIEKTVRKFEYTSPFFIRHMTSINRVSDKEVQDFCDELDKRYTTNK